MTSARFVNIGVSLLETLRCSTQNILDLIESVILQVYLTALIFIGSFALSAKEILFQCYPHLGD